MNQDLLKYSNIFQDTDCLTKDQLLNYVNNNLSGSELRQVELHLCDCPFCSDAVDGLNENGTAGFEASLDRMQQGIDGTASVAEKEATVIEFPRHTASEGGANTPGKRRSLGLFFSVAAAVALLVASAFIFIGGSMTPNQVADKHYVLVGPEILRSPSDDDAIMAKGKVMMNDSQYAEAAVIFQQIPNDEAAYFAGDCFYQLKKFDDAKAEFQRAIQLDSTNFRFQAELKLAITCLKLNEVSEAKSVLEKIVNTKGHVEQKAASAILDDLRDVKME